MTAKKAVTRLGSLLLVGLLAIVLAVGVPRSAEAQDNTAVIVNTVDDLELWRLSFKVVRTMQEVVDQSNAAVAVNAGCTGCESYAIALQVVLVFSDPDAVTSQNIALAFNELCSSCVAVAEAYQWVLTTGGVVRFTAEANRRLAEIYRRLQELRNSDLTIEALQAELDAIEAEIEDILATELVPVGTQPAPESEEAPTETTTTTETDTTETTETTETTGTTTTTSP